MSSPYSSNGNIRQQDRQACNIARSAIAQYLALEARQTAVIVSSTIGRILLNQETARPLDEIWKQIQNHPDLRLITRKADANVDDYRQFAGWVNGERRNIANVEKKRLEDEVGFRIFTARFGNCVRLQKLHLAPAN